MPELGIDLLLSNLNWPAKNKMYYEEALTHSSYAYESGLGKSNERLEFLGDAVLELVISEYLFKNFPEYPEGKLTQIRHRVVNEASLAEIAREIDLGSFIKLGKGELLSGGPEKNSLLADALEALIGALFVDLGYNESTKLLLELFRPTLDNVVQGILPLSDYKTLLQELCQSSIGKVPFYRIASESGPPHDRNFEAEVLLDKQVIGRGRGKSKKEAEQAAAKKACKWFQDNVAR